MNPAPAFLSLEQLEALARLEAALEQRVFGIAIEVGASLKGGGGLSSEMLQRFREAHADWEASRSVSEVAARRSKDWHLRETVIHAMRRERIEAQHRNWLAQIQNADHSGDRTGDLVRVLARMSADLVMQVDHSEPTEAEVDARVAELLAKRAKKG